MALNNNLLFNAALAGFIEGVESSRGVKSATAADYASVVAAGVVFATAVDTGIVADGTITGGGAGVALATAASDNVAVSKCGAMRSAAAAVWQGKATTSTTAADYAQSAAACIALYTQLIASLVIP